MLKASFFKLNNLFELLFFKQNPLTYIWEEDRANFDWEERLEIVSGRHNLWQWECVTGYTSKTCTEVDYVELAE